MSLNKNKILKPSAIITSSLLALGLSSIAAADAMQVINYDDGAQYKGEVKNGERHGYGEIQWANGDRYEGQWQDDQPNGYGTKSYVDSSTYEGDFLAGVQHGKGLFTYPDGTTYKGDWKNDTPNGLGTFTFKEAGTYEGFVMLGLPHGQGSFSYSNGDFYDGQWEHGKRHGMGKLKYKNGNVFIGSFADGNESGEGALTYSNGARFKGNFKNGKPHGDGTCFNATEQALCSYEHGSQVAYAVIPREIKETPKPKPITTPVIAAVAKQSPSPKPVVTLAKKIVSAKKSFVSALKTEKEQLKPQYSVSDLKAGRSDILFNHNFESLKLTKALRTGTWEKRSGLFDDHLVLHTLSGDLKIRLKIKLFDGPGTYRVKPSDIKAWFKGKKLEGLKDFANTITIKEIDKQWVAGNINISFNQKDNFGDHYKVEDGVFRLNNQPVYSPYR